MVLYFIGACCIDSYWLADSLLYIVKLYIHMYVKIKMYTCVYDDCE